MRIDPENPKHIFADEGMRFVGKVNEIKMGDELILGFYKYDGVYRQETPEDFYEIEKEDEPEIEVEG